MGRKKIITSEMAEEMRELRFQNWTVKQLAEKYNCSTSVIDNAIKAYRLTLDIGERICEVCGRTYAANRVNQVCCSVKCLRRKKIKSIDESVIIEQIKKRLPGFEYAGNYTGHNGTADLKCLKCGWVQTRSSVTIRHRNVVCDKCVQIEKDKKAEKKQAEREKNEAERIERRFKKRCNEIAKNIFRIATEKHLCAYCGKLMRGKSSCCSNECAKKRINNLHENIRRARERDAMIDEDITLNELYRRDNGVCYLCGGRCSWDDGSWESGAFVVGKNYPSIDHVIPLSKGGKHSWDNVRLAHHWCNTKKGNRYAPRCAVG